MSAPISVSEIPALAKSVTDAAAAVVRGAEGTIKLLTAALLCGGHVLLEDLPGTGKTTLVKAIAKLTGCSDKRIQCTPDLMPADLTGFEMLVQEPDGSRKMQFRKGPVFTNLLLADEINRMAPRSQAGLLECMAEYQVTAGGVRYDLPKPFFVLATQNPIELQGTFPLPEAQLDRFFMCLHLGTPERGEERRILTERQTSDPLDALQPVTDPETLCAAQEAVRTVNASESVLDYLLDLADATRSHKQVQYGLSTRGTLALRHAAQAFAAMEGRDYLLPDDVKAVFPSVCAHRLKMAGGLFSDRQAAEKVVEEILAGVGVRKHTDAKADTVKSVDEILGGGVPKA